MENKDIENISDVTELGLEPLSEYANRICYSCKDVDFLNSRTYSVDDTVNLNGPYNRIMDIKDYTARVEVNKKDKEFLITPKWDCIIEQSFEKEKNFNNRTNEPSITEYEILIKRANNSKIKLANIDPEKLYDIKEFKKAVGGFCTLTEKEVLELIKQKSENSHNYIEEFCNTGKKCFDKMD